MKTAIRAATIGKAEGIPPRERILAVAADLFYRHGIRAVGVEAIAEAAGTNKMMRCLAEKASASWDKLAAQHAGDPRAQLRAWLENMAGRLDSGDQRGCALANAAVELPEKDHPARPVIEAFKNAQRNRITQLCAAADLAQPELLADELFLLLEGARVTAQSMGRAGLGERLIRMGEAMIAAHLK